MADKIKFKGRMIDPETTWYEWFSTDAFGVDKRLRRAFRLLPSDPRCKFCNAPFQGAGGTLVRFAFGKERSALNPRYCNMCDQASRLFPGGSEVAMAMLFADIRGSTALSEKVSATAFSRLINRFYTVATKIISDADGLVEKLAGDAVAAFWGSGFAGQGYVQRTVQTAQELSRRMVQEQIPVGIAVHAGMGYFGAVGSVGGLVDITAVGEEVNTAARLAAQAAAGEIIVSERAVEQAGLDGNAFESRRLELKGLAQPVPVRVMHAI